MNIQLRDLVETGEVEEVQGALNRPIAGLASDSRKVKRGQLFFAVPGLHVDGHEFVGHAVERGAAAVVVERKVPLPPTATWLRVQNVKRTMGRWAALFNGYPSRRMVLVGVTGTNGKTTVTYLLESIFSASGMSGGVIGTIEYRFGGRKFPAHQTTPDAIELQALLAEMAQAGVQSLGIEVSSHALEMERVRGVDFDGALFTNLSRDHLDFHGDMERYFFAKSRLFTELLPESSKASKFAVVRGDDPRGEELLEKIRAAGLEAVSYGLGAQWDVHPLEWESDVNGMRGRIQIRGRELAFTTRLIGGANLENILGAVGVGCALRLSLASIAEGIARLGVVPGRLQRIENDLGISVIVDYAHTPDALEKVLLALRPLTRGRVIAVFGCGGDRDRGKRPLMGEIAARLADLVVLTSDNPRTEKPLGIIREIEGGVRRAGLVRLPAADLRSRIPHLESERGYWVEPDRRASIRLALSLARTGDLVLIAGKGHEDYQIVGKRRSPFDDREVAREQLRELMA